MTCLPKRAFPLHTLPLNIIPLHALPLHALPLHALPFIPCPCIHYPYMSCLNVTLAQPPLLSFEKAQAPLRSPWQQYHSIYFPCCLITFYVHIEIVILSFNDVDMVWLLYYNNHAFPLHA
jgi:hypothetical protein